MTQAVGAFLAVAAILCIRGAAREVLPNGLVISSSLPPHEATPDAKEDEFIVVGLNEPATQEDPAGQGPMIQLSRPINWEYVHQLGAQLTLSGSQKVNIALLMEWKWLALELLEDSHEAGINEVLDLFHRRVAAELDARQAAIYEENRGDGKYAYRPAARAAAETLERDLLECFPFTGRDPGDSRRASWERWRSQAIQALPVELRSDSEYRKAIDQFFHRALGEFAEDFGVDLINRPPIGGYAISEVGFLEIDEKALAAPDPPISAEQEARNLWIAQWDKWKRESNAALSMAERNNPNYLKVSDTTYEEMVKLHPPVYSITIYHDVGGATR